MVMGEDDDDDDKSCIGMYSSSSSSSSSSPPASLEALVKNIHHSLHAIICHLNSTLINLVAGRWGDIPSSATVMNLREWYAILLAQHDEM